jgi:3-keto-5-aminohexanoate cleavage enzyme
VGLTPPTADSLLLSCVTFLRGELEHERHGSGDAVAALGGFGHRWPRPGRLEDNPYLPDGRPSRSNAELVDEIVRLSRSLGREPATAGEARAIIGVNKPVIEATPVASRPGTGGR